MASPVSRLLLLCVLFLGTIAASLGSESSTVTFSNARRFLFDVDGNQIDAYGSKINWFNGTYYLFGNSFSTTGVAFGVKAYSSNDLKNWQYEGFLYDPFVPNPCNVIGGCGRPHIVYNERTSTYVLWMNAGNPGYVIATAKTPTGPYKFIGRSTLDPAFSALQPADFAVESFGDRAYLVFSALNFRYPNAGSIWPPIQQTLHISELTPDYTNTTTASHNVTSAAYDLIDQEAESPDIFMRNGLFYIVASNTCGYCNGSIALVYRSPTISGPWTRQIIASDGCNSQVEGILPLSTANNETTYIWHGTSVPGGPRVGFSGHIFQPLLFNPDGSVQDLNCNPSAHFSVPFTHGTSPTASGNATLATTITFPPDAIYTPICDSDQFTLFQTFPSTSSGMLKSISVNIAAIAAPGIQSVPLTLHAFKFSNVSALTQPNYRWVELGNATCNSTQLSYVFDVVSVFLDNVSVEKGDMLGVSIAGSDFVPYCHLEYDVARGEGEGKVLLQQGQGQNSWRGLDGRKSVVYERVGRGVRFMAVVV